MLQRYEMQTDLFAFCDPFLYGLLK